jgi:hypothetical protein
MIMTIHRIQLMSADAGRSYTPTFLLRRAGAGVVIPVKQGGNRFSVLEERDQFTRRFAFAAAFPRDSIGDLISDDRSRWVRSREAVVQLRLCTTPLG